MSRPITFAPFSSGKKIQTKKPVSAFKKACDKVVEANRSTSERFKDLSYSIQKRLGIDTPEGRAQVKAEIKAKCQEVADKTKTAAKFGIGKSWQAGRAFSVFAKGVKESYISSKQNFMQNYVAYLEYNAAHNEKAAAKLEDFRAKQDMMEAKAAYKAAKAEYRVDHPTIGRRMWESAKDHLETKLRTMGIDIDGNGIITKDEVVTVKEVSREPIVDAPEANPTAVALAPVDRSDAQLNEPATRHSLENISSALDKVSDYKSKELYESFLSMIKSQQEHLAEMRAKLEASVQVQDMRDRADVAAQMAAQVGAEQPAPEPLEVFGC